VRVLVQGLLNMSLPDVLAQWVGANQANIKLPQVRAAKQQQQRKCSCNSIKSVQRILTVTDHARCRTPRT
jgi:hypothetical protein